MDHPLTTGLIRWIVIIPLIGAALNFLAGASLQKKIGKRAISLIGCGSVVLAFLIAARAFTFLLTLPPDERFLLDNLWRWLEVG